MEQRRKEKEILIAYHRGFYVFISVQRRDEVPQDIRAAKSAPQYQDLSAAYVQPLGIDNTLAVQTAKALLEQYPKKLSKRGRAKNPPGYTSVAVASTKHTPGSFSKRLRTPQIILLISNQSVLCQKKGARILSLVIYPEQQPSPPVVSVYVAAQGLIMTLKIMTGYAVIDYGSGSLTGR
jgi:hypothetical protein